MVLKSELLLCSREPSTFAGFQSEGAAALARIFHAQDAIGLRDFGASGILELDSSNGSRARRSFVLPLQTLLERASKPRKSKPASHNPKPSVRPKSPHSCHDDVLVLKIGFRSTGQQENVHAPFAELTE